MSIYSEIKPEVRMFADMCVENSKIDPELYVKYDVKRGLRDLNGKGVLTGLTEHFGDHLQQGCGRRKVCPAKASFTTAATTWKSLCAGCLKDDTLWL